MKATRCSGSASTSNPNNRRSARPATTGRAGSLLQLGASVIHGAMIKTPVNIV
jgi:hypothetical protein